MKQSDYTMGTKVRIFIDPQGLHVQIGLLAAAALAEVWLARREARWPGLILPGLAFLRGAVKMVCDMDNWPSVIALGGALLEFALCNIATLVLLAIYAVCRESRRRQRRLDLEKMQRDDLKDL